MKRKRVWLFAIITSMGLCGCMGGYGYDTSEPNPDYTIKIMRDANGQAIAVPPKCPSWNTSATSPIENQPWPQYGCANARNLAAEVANPNDLLQGRDFGAASGTTTSSAVNRYNEGKTKVLYDPKANAPATSGGGGGGLTQ